MSVHGTSPSRITRWLDWWCSSRWRTLITWIALFDVSYAPLPKHLGWLYDQLGVVTQSFAKLIPLPVATLQLAWLSCLVSLILSWYQPVLLRLSLIRGVLWLCAPLVVTFIAEFTGIRSRPWVFRMHDFVLLFLPTLALIGIRKPFLGLVLAAAASGATIHLGRFRYNWVMADAVYASIIILGTSRIPKRTPQAVQ